MYSRHVQQTCIVDMYSRQGSLVASLLAIMDSWSSTISILILCTIQGQLLQLSNGHFFQVNSFNAAFFKLFEVHNINNTGNWENAEKKIGNTSNGNIIQRFICIPFTVTYSIFSISSCLAVKVVQNSSSKGASSLSIQHKCYKCLRIKDKIVELHK